MMPTFNCPVCRNTLTIETVFAHEGVRNAIQSLIDMHPDASKLLRPVLGYVGLFAPTKTAMRYERIATILEELTEHIRSASIEGNNQIYTAPMSYWRQAIEEILARRDAGQLRLPLANHNYLYKIVLGYCEKAEAKSEEQLEKQRARHSGYGTTTERKAEPEAFERKPPPPHILEKYPNLKGFFYDEKTQNQKKC